MGDIMYNRLNTLFLVFFVFLTGCTIKTAQVELCSETNIPLAEIAPPDSADRKVVFLGVDDSKANADGAGLAGLVESGTTTIIGKTGTDIADPDLADSLRVEIRRYEIRGTSNFKSTLATNAVEGEVVNADLSATFHERYKIETEKGTKWSTAYCSYAATVTGNVKIYSVNPLELIASVPINGDSKMRIDTSNADCPFTQDQKLELFRSAALDGASNKIFKDGVFDQFRQVGHIRELRQCSDDEEANYVWLSTSPDQGAAPGSGVTIYRQYWYEDKLNDTRNLRRKPVATGEIVPTNNTNEAWVHIEDQNAAQSIMLGDIAEITFSDCDQAFKLLCNLPGI
jgi:hypothetical protein